MLSLYRVDGALRVSPSLTKRLPQLAATSPPLFSFFFFFLLLFSFSFLTIRSLSSSSSSSLQRGAAGMAHQRLSPPPPHRQHAPTPHHQQLHAQQQPPQQPPYQRHRSFPSYPPSSFRPQHQQQQPNRSFLKHAERFQQSGPTSDHLPFNRHVQPFQYQSQFQSQKRQSFSKFTPLFRSISSHEQKHVRGGFDDCVIRAWAPNWIDLTTLERIMREHCEEVT